MSAKIIENKQTIKLRIVSRFSLYVIFLFLIFHYVCTAPVINFLCICPQENPAWKCACNCSKCVQRRQATDLSFNISPIAKSLEGRPSACEIKNSIDTHRTLPNALMPIATPTLSKACNYRQAGKDILQDIKQLIPILPVAKFVDSLEQLIYPAEIQPIADYIPRPLESPG
jgi:hypothetical protein